ncbi:MAG: EamA family transporter [Myxococcales bacterium]|nr:EamA family transporter [Myxococcales bacterium]
MPAPQTLASGGGSAARSGSVLFVLVAVLCAVWGSTWLVIRGGLRDLPPFTSAGVRFAIAAVVMTGVAAALRRREGGESPPLWLSCTLGLTSFAGSYGVVYWCETVLPSGLVALLWSVYPMIQAVAGHLFLPGERLNRRQWIGFLFGLAGLALLFGTDLQGFGDAGIPAALLLFASPVLATIGSTVTKRFGGGVSSVLLNRDAMFAGAIVLLALALSCEQGAIQTWSAQAVASVLYLALVGTALTFGVYFWLLRRFAAHKLGLISYVVPVIALALGWGFGSEPVTTATLGGAALILFGVVIVARVRGPSAPADARRDRADGGDSRESG